DHFGKPGSRTSEFTVWRGQIKELAENPNVHCKLSALVTEADWKRWTITDLQPFVDVVMDLFGPNRLVFGGDWPVVTLASTYKRWLDTALQFCGALSTSERIAVFYQNGLDFYLMISLLYIGTYYVNIQYYHAR